MTSSIAISETTHSYLYSLFSEQTYYRSAKFVQMLVGLDTYLTATILAEDVYCYINEGNRPKKQLPYLRYESCSLSYQDEDNFKPSEITKTIENDDTYRNIVRGVYKGAFWKDEKSEEKEPVTDRDIDDIVFLKLPYRFIVSFALRQWAFLCYQISSKVYL